MSPRGASPWGPVVHELRTWPAYFAAVLDGEKTFEIRKDDGRIFMVGDVLLLREWYKVGESYSGRALRVRVLYVARLSTIPGFPAIDRAWVVMGLGKPVLEP